MLIRIIKPEFPENNNSCSAEQDRQTITELEEFIAQLQEYITSLRYLLYFFTFSTVLLTVLYSWYSLFLITPILIYFIRKYNISKFEYSIHCFMLKLNRELLIEKSTGHIGPILSHLM
jgi:hypothetical protein